MKPPTSKMSEQEFYVALQARATYSVPKLDSINLKEKNAGNAEIADTSVLTKPADLSLGHSE